MEMTRNTGMELTAKRHNGMLRRSVACVIISSGIVLGVSGVWNAFKEDSGGLDAVGKSISIPLKVKEIKILQAELNAVKDAQRKEWINTYNNATPNFLGYIAMGIGGGILLIGGPSILGKKKE